MVSAKQLRSRFARNMRARREALGLTQKQLAGRLKVSQPVVCDLEHDRTSPGLELVARVAAALKTTPAALLSDEPAKVAS